MLTKPNVRPWVMLLAGVAVGWAIAYLIPARDAEAVGNDRFENFSVCTASVDGTFEAFYFLDFTSGELKAAVLNSRSGKFTTFFQRNILVDFDLEGIKKPRFLMVSGRADFQRIAGRPQMAHSAVYVSELISGRMMAYSVPWNSQRSVAISPVRAEILPIDVVQIREVIRPGD